MARLHFAARDLPAPWPRSPHIVVRGADGQECGRTEGLLRAGSFFPRWLRFVEIADEAQPLTAALCDGGPTAPFAAGDVLAAPGRALDLPLPAGGVLTVFAPPPAGRRGLLVRLAGVDADCGAVAVAARRRADGAELWAGAPVEHERSPQWPPAVLPAESDEELVLGIAGPGLELELPLGPGEWPVGGGLLHVEEAACGTRFEALGRLQTGDLRGCALPAPLAAQLPHTLQELDVSHCGLEAGQLAPLRALAQLRRLRAAYNALAGELPEPPPRLELLDVQHNALEALPAALPAGLQFLRAQHNRLAALPAAMPAALEWLDASSNALEALPEALPPRLTHLHVARNRLRALPDALPAALWELDAEHNRIGALPALGGLSALCELRLAGNVVRAGAESSSSEVEEELRARLRVLTL